MGTTHRGEVAAGSTDKQRNVQRDKIGCRLWANTVVWCRLLDRSQEGEIREQGAD